MPPDKPDTELTVDDPRVEQLKRMSTKDLATMLMGISIANPSGDEDWKKLIRDEINQRKDIFSNE